MDDQRVHADPGARAVARARRGVRAQGSVRAIEGGSWPARGWNDIKPNCRQGRCRWKPIMGSGCRYFGRIAMTPCYLRTYTYLLTQHRRLLTLADGVAGSEELLVDERIEMDKVRGKLKKLEAEVRYIERDMETHTLLLRRETMIHDRRGGQ